MLPLILLSALLAGCGSWSHSPGLSDSGYQNAVFNQNFPDPFILRLGDDYYAYATNADARNVQVIRSRDGTNWERVGLTGDALPNLPQWAKERVGLTWAPSVLQRGDEFLLYYTARPKSEAVQCISYATSNRPDGPFG